MSKKVFITRTIPHTGIKKLQDNGLQCDVWPGHTPPPYEVLLEKSKKAEGLICMLSDKIDQPFLEQNKQLKVISNFAVGYNNIDIEAATRLGIKVGNTPGVLTEATADLTLSLILASARRHREAYANVLKGEWKNWEPMGFLGMELKGKALGIFGMGRIGQAVARRCHLGFGMKVIYTSRAEKELDFDAHKVEFDELLKNSDVLSLHTNLTAETEGLFQAQTIQKMKPGSIFINTARGKMHSEADLLKALETEHLFALGLDVTEPEPMLSTSPLLAHPRCHVLPHIGSATTETRQAMALICAKNVIAGLENKEAHFIN